MQAQFLGPLLNLLLVALHLADVAREAPVVVPLRQVAQHVLQRLHNLILVLARGGQRLLHLFVGRLAEPGRRPVGPGHL